jgi:hypothetical protein
MGETSTGRMITTWERRGSLLTILTKPLMEKQTDHGRAIRRKEARFGMFMKMVI